MEVDRAQHIPIEPLGMVLQSVQVDPKKWWDPHWIKDRVTSKLEQFGRSGPAH